MTTPTRIYMTSRIRGLTQQCRWRCVATLLAVNLLLAMYLYPVLQGPRVSRRLHVNRHQGITGLHGNRLTGVENTISGLGGNTLSVYDSDLVQRINQKGSEVSHLVVNTGSHSSKTHVSTVKHIAPAAKTVTTVSTPRLTKPQRTPKHLEKEHYVQQQQMQHKPQQKHQHRTPALVKAQEVSSVRNVDSPNPKKSAQKLSNEQYPAIVNTSSSNKVTRNGTIRPVSNIKNVTGIRNITGKDTLLYHNRREDNPVLHLPHGHFVVQPDKPCDENTFLLIVVCSSVENFALRNAIRETWGMDAQQRQLGIKVVFMLGQPLEQHLAGAIEREGARYDDVIQQQIVDHYTNLSLKSLGYLRWSGQHCSKARFVMKTDDDIFLNIPNLLEALGELNQLTRQRVILGHVIENAKPIQDRASKWYTSTTVFKRKVYPMYMSGTAYVMSGELVMGLLKKAYTSEFFWLEDVYITGMLGHLAGATLHHDTRFGYHKRSSNPCVYRLVITGHQMTPTDLTKLWTNLHKPDLNCPQAAGNFHFDKRAQRN